MLELKLIVQSTFVLFLSIVNMMNLAPHFTRKTMEFTLASADKVLKTVSGSFSRRPELDATPAMTMSPTATPSQTMPINASTPSYDDYTIGKLSGVEEWSSSVSLKPLDASGHITEYARRLVLSFVAELQAFVSGVDSKTLCIAVFMLALTFAVVVVKIARKVVIARASREERHNRPVPVEYASDILNVRFDSQAAPVSMSGLQHEFNAFTTSSNMDQLSWLTADVASISLDPFALGLDSQSDGSIDDVTPATVLSPSLTTLFTFGRQTEHLDASPSTESFLPQFPSFTGLAHVPSSATMNSVASAEASGIFTPAEITATSSVMDHARLTANGSVSISGETDINVVDPANVLLPAGSNLSGSSSPVTFVTTLPIVALDLPVTPAATPAPETTTLVSAGTEGTTPHECTLDSLPMELPVTPTMPVIDHPVTDDLEQASSASVDNLDAELSQDTSVTCDLMSSRAIMQCNQDYTTTTELPPNTEDEDDDDDGVFIYPGASPETDVQSTDVTSIAVVGSSGKADSSSDYLSMLDTNDHPELLPTRGLGASMWADAEPTPPRVSASLPALMDSPPAPSMYFFGAGNEWQNSGFPSVPPTPTPMGGRGWYSNKTENGPASPTRSDAGRWSDRSRHWHEDTSPSPLGAPRAPRSLQKPNVTSCPSSPTRSGPSSASSTGDRSPQRDSPPADSDSQWPSGAGAAASMWAQEDAPVDTSKAQTPDACRAGFGMRNRKRRVRGKGQQQGTSGTRKGKGASKA